MFVWIHNFVVRISGVNEKHYSYVNEQITDYCTTRIQYTTHPQCLVIRDCHAT